MPIQSNRRATTTILSQALVGGQAQTLSITHETVPHPVEIFSPQMVDTPEKVSRALERIQQHVRESTASSRSLPTLGGCYFPNVKIPAGSTVSLTHGLGAAVSFAVLDVRMTSPTDVPAVLVDAGQDAPGNRLLVKTTTACTVDVHVFPRPLAIGSQSVQGAQNTGLVLPGPVVLPSNIPPGGLNGQILFTGVSSSGDPSTLPGLGTLAAWYRADTVVLNGSNVSQLTDKTGNGNHFTQSTPANQPLWLPASVPLNGQPALSFNGVTSSSFMTAVSLSVSQPLTFYIAGFCLSVGTVPAMLEANGGNFHLVVQPSTGYEFEDGISATSTGVQGGTTPHALCATMGGVLGNDYYVDTSETPTAVSASNGTTPIVSPHLGNLFGNTSFSMTGQIAEVIIYAGLHTVSQRRAVMGYLAARYGLATNGPALAPEWLFASGDVVPSGIFPNGLKVIGFADVPISQSAPSPGALWLFTGSEWLPVQTSGDVQVSSAGRETVRALQGRSFSPTAPTAGQVPVFSQGFLPSSLTGLQLWLRSDSVVTDGAGNVSQWTDQSGNARHALQSTAGFRPSYVGSDPLYAGLPSLQFSANSDTRMLVASLPQAQPYTCYAVAFPASSGAQAIISDQANGGMAILSLNNTIYQAINPFPLGAASGSSALAHVIAAIGDNAVTQNSIFVDSTTAVTGNTGAAAFTALTIGREAPTGSPAESFTGSIVEILVYSGVHSAAQVKSVMGYLADRYGLTVTGSTAPGFTGWVPAPAGGVTSVAAGSGISVSGSTGAVTITNTAPGTTSVLVRTVTVVGTNGSIAASTTLSSVVSMSVPMGGADHVDVDAEVDVDLAGGTSPFNVTLTIRENGTIVRTSNLGVPALGGAAHTDITMRCRVRRAPGSTATYTLDITNNSLFAINWSSPSLLAYVANA